MTQPIEATLTNAEDADAIWMARLRFALNETDVGPAFCIQGGGARGAWEAGVLAGLLKAGPRTKPSSIWGTSAGALNALWSRDPSVQAKPTNLLHYWATLARRLIGLAAAIIAGSIFCCALFLWTVWHYPKLTFTGTAVVLSVLLLVNFLAKTRVLVRLPGLIHPAIVRLIVPRPEVIAPGWYVYTCVSDVDSESRPDIWGSSMRGWFRLDRNTSTRLAEDMGDGKLVDAFDVAVASASVPVAVRPTRLAGMTLLDGGLVANLPAGFILSHGALGGAYVLCVVPRNVADLSNSDPIDHRTLRFLFDLRSEQAKHRSAAAPVSSWSGPVHTHTPVFVLSPKKHLESGLYKFWPPLLREEFSQGFGEAIAFSAALDAFSKGSVELSREYLLEHVLEKCRAPDGQPPRRAWYKWVNTSW